LVTTFRYTSPNYRRVLPGWGRDLVLGLATSAMPADYRIFVRSRFLAPKTAAMLFAAAHIPARVLAGKIAASR
jgi:hypothetical protein